MSKAEKFIELFTSPLGVLWPEHPRSSLSCIQAGLSLQILKSEMDHGVFYSLAHGHGFTEKNVDAFMECSRRFGLDEVILVIAARSSQKLVRLLYLEDAEVKALCRGETVRGLTLDTLPAMSPNEVANALIKPNPQADLVADVDKLLLHFRKLSPTARAHVIKSAELLLSENAAIRQ